MWKWNDGTDYLMHHGIKGQKWGIRRFQNEDGTLTPAGKERYKRYVVSSVDRVSYKPNSIKIYSRKNRDQDFKRIFAAVNIAEKNNYELMRTGAAVRLMAAANGLGLYSNGYNLRNVAKQYTDSLRNYFHTLFGKDDKTVSKDVKYSDIIANIAYEDAIKSQFEKEYPDHKAERYLVKMLYYFGNKFDKYHEQYSDAGYNLFELEDTAAWYGDNYKDLHERLDKEFVDARSKYIDAIVKEIGLSKKDLGDGDQKAREIVGLAIDRYDMTRSMNKDENTYDDDILDYIEDIKFKKL